MSALGRLRPLVQLALALCTSPLGSLSGSETEECDPVTLPPLASVRALTEIRLEGAVRLPPDWGQLTGLSALRINPHPLPKFTGMSFNFPNLTRLECTLLSQGTGALRIYSCAASAIF